jgi:hypothetical protein
MTRLQGRSGALGIVALAVLGSVVVILLATRAPGSGEGAPSAPTPSQASEMPTRAAAVTTAIAALYGLSVPAVIDRQRFRAVLQRVAAPGSRARVAALFGAVEPAVAAAFSRRPRVLRGAPLGYRLERFSATAASVSIWTVAIAASPGFAPQSQWRTVRVDLTWTEAGWKVTGGRGANGPAPSTPLPALATAAASFRELSHAP